MAKQAIVIGSGIAGLAMAVRLALKSYQVSVFEKNALPGGKISEIRNNGFRFDTGPSLFTMPNYLEDLFKQAGVPMEDYLKVKRLDTLSNYYFDDGSFIRAHSNIDAFAKEASAETGEPATNILKFFRSSQSKYDLSGELFIRRSFHKPATFFSGSFWKAALQAWKLDPLRSMNRANEAHFHDARMIQLFNRFATYNGSSPYKAPATLNMIPYLEHQLGAFFPEGGIYTIVRSLYELAHRLGVYFYFEEAVREILISDKRVQAVLTNKTEAEADIVVSAIDIHYLYKHLLPGIKPPQKLYGRQKSSSAVIFYWGIRNEFPELDLHNVFFSGNYAEEFRYLFDLKLMYDDPTVYVYISKKMNSADAPEDAENWFVMVNAPENTGQDWESILPELKKNILKKLSRQLGKEIASYIQSETIGDPRWIEATTHTYHGSLYGNSSNGKWAAFQRHPNFIRGIHGLYCVGGSVHPGGGIPLCLSSAEIVDRWIPRLNKSIS